MLCFVYTFQGSLSCVEYTVTASSEGNLISRTSIIQLWMNKGKLGDRFGKRRRLPKTLPKRNKSQEFPISVPNRRSCRPLCPLDNVLMHSKNPQVPGGPTNCHCDTGGMLNPSRRRLARWRGSELCGPLRLSTLAPNLRYAVRHSSGSLPSDVVEKPPECSASLSSVSSVLVAMQLLQKKTR